MRPGTSSALTLLGRQRFTLLFVSICLALALRPFLTGFIRITILTDIFISMILISAVGAISEKKRTLFGGLLLVLPSLLMKWSTHVASSALLLNVSYLFGALFIGYALIFILISIVRQQQVTTDLIMAALCGYFLIGFMWSFIFFFVESTLPGSFQVARPGSSDLDHFIYFSFVTLTTVGYGDIVPLGNGARSLAILEAAMGQLYLAVVIARLVGIHISHKQDKQG